MIDPWYIGLEQSPFSLTRQSHAFFVVDVYWHVTPFAGFVHVHKLGQTSLVHFQVLVPLRLSVLKPSRSEHENNISFTTKWGFSVRGKSFFGGYFLHLELLKVSEIISFRATKRLNILISPSNFLTLLSYVLSKKNKAKQNKKLRQKTRSSAFLSQFFPHEIVKIK